MFIHHSNINEENIKLYENQNVIFDKEIINNKNCAVNLKLQEPIIKNSKKHVRNTKDFSPSYESHDTRLMFSNNIQKSEYEITSKDVIVIKNLFNENENIYHNLKTEIANTGIHINDLWKSWHGVDTSISKNYNLINLTIFWKQIYLNLEL